MEVSFFARRSGSTVGATATRDVSLASDNRINAMLLHGVVERDCSEHVAVISHGARSHAQFFDTGGERFYLDSAIEQAVIGMKMEVCKLTFCHESVDAQAL